MPTLAAASLVTGLPGSFLACVQCFELVQFGRRFKGDFAVCAAKFRLCDIRLLRWGVAVGLSSSDEQQDARLPARLDEYPEAQLKTAQEVLEDIAAAFHRAQRRSQQFKSLQSGPEIAPKARAETFLTEEDELQTELTPMSLSCRTLNKVRQQYTAAVEAARSAKDRTKWALYEKKHLNILIDEVSELMGSLESLFPELLEVREGLVRAEAKAFGNETLQALPEVAAEYDPALIRALEAESKARGSSFTSIETKEFAKTHLGNAYAPGEKGGASHTFTKMVFGGFSETHAGDSYGYKTTTSGQQAPSNNAS